MPQIESTLAVAFNRCETYMYFIMTAVRRIFFLALAAIVIGLYLGFTDGFRDGTIPIIGIGAAVAVVTGGMIYFIDDE